MVVREKNKVEIKVVGALLAKRLVKLLDKDSPYNVVQNYQN